MANENKPRGKAKTDAAGRGGQDRHAPQPPLPVQVIEGVPDRSARPATWKYVLLAALFLAWVAFLLLVNYFGSAK